jgi:hypothetical protein
MPGGHRDTSFRSRASSKDCLTFIESANAASVIPRRSRWARNLGPNAAFELIDICERFAAGQLELTGSTSKRCIIGQLRSTTMVSVSAMMTSASEGNRKILVTAPLRNGSSHFWCAPYAQRLQFFQVGLQHPRPSCRPRAQAGRARPKRDRRGSGEYLLMPDERGLMTPGTRRYDGLGRLREGVPSVAYASHTEGSSRIAVWRDVNIPPR